MPACVPDPLFFSYLIFFLFLVVLLLYEEEMRSKKTQSLRFVIGATVIGNTLEWFDFALVGALAPLFAHLFFPPGSSESYPLFFFALSALARPIGGFVFGRLGDRGGRRNALIKTVMLMTIPVFLLAIMPSYEQIGGAAVAILAIVCLLQGFSTGGEFPGSIVFLVESSPSKIRGYVGSFAYFGALLGMLFSVLDLYFVKKTTGTNFEAWGWRLPFIVGTVLGILAVFFRTALEETPVFKEEVKTGAILKSPVFTSFKHTKQLVTGLMIFMLDAVGFNLIFVFSSYYFTTILGLALKQAFLINTFTVFVALISIPFAGKISNYLGFYKLSKWAAVAMIVLALPLYLMMNPQQLWTIYFAQAVLALLLSLYLANLPAIIADIYPAPIRYSSCALVTNFSVALFGGTAPLLASFFITHTKISCFPALYLIAGALISLFALNSKIHLQKS